MGRTLEGLCESHHLISPIDFQMITNTIYPTILRLSDRIREKIRWKNTAHSSIPRVYYGQRHIPSREDILSGGLVKLQDMISKFPNYVKKPNILYLISSALPPNPDILLHYARKTNTPIVLNQNGVAYPAWHGAGWEETNKRLASVYTQASFIIFQSTFCKTGAQKFLGPTLSPHTTLHNPINLQQFKPPTDNRRPEERRRLLVAGSHHFFYRVKIALDVLAILTAKGDNYKLQIAGRCCWKESEEECHKETLAYAYAKNIAERIEITGAYTQQEAAPMFQGSDVLIHPTYNDSCPRLVIEAMACGTPVVYSATGGTPELVAEKAGIGIKGPLDWEKICPPAPEKMAQAVGEIVEKYSYFSQGAREHAVQHFQVDDWLQKHKEIFLDLLSSK